MSISDWGQRRDLRELFDRVYRLETSVSDLSVEVDRLTRTLEKLTPLLPPEDPKEREGGPIQVTFAPKSKGVLDPSVSPEDARLVQLVQMGWLDDAAVHHRRTHGSTEVEAREFVETLARELAGGEG
ncbi:hypothetical protein ACPYO6_01835 [Georgenia sp. Z1344]|uniref:hypothetical protein n=1 Tax=Georgenia sp. Z1344 TaxID=3416706 RepID=UPI003CF040E6